MQILTKWKNTLTTSIRQIPSNIESHVGWYTTVLATVTGIAFRIPVEAAVSGGILYSMILAKKYLDHRMYKETMDSIDIDRLMLPKDNPLIKEQPISEIIGNYVEDCFNRDVLFFNVIKEDDYVDEPTEKRLLHELIDSVASNMSKPLRTKLALYYGEDSLDIVLGRKCLATVTLYVATHNHKIYDGTK